MELELKNVSKRFSDVTAVNHVNLTFPDGQLTGLLGPSGCGKSTLLYMISGLENVTEGAILFGGNDVTELPPEKRNIGLVFQNYALYPHMTVAQNIAFPLTNIKNSKSGKRYTREEQNAEVERVSKLVQIDDCLTRKPKQLSGGQQQRVAIARALVKHPAVLLLDEPLSNLDARLRMEMRQEIRRIQQETKVTTIFVTHDQEEALSITDTIVLMKSGEVQQTAGAHDMYMDPCNQFVASFLGNPPITFLDANAGNGVVQLKDDTQLPFSIDITGRVIVGIRPEAWIPGDEIHPEVNSVELRGQDQVITFYLAGTTVKAVLDAEQSVTIGAKIGLSLRKKRCYFFDPATGKRLRT